MVTVHLTEAELAQDVHAALVKVRHGMEIVIDDDSRAVAVLRMISDTSDEEQLWDAPDWA